MTTNKWQVHCCPGANGFFLPGPHFHLLNNPEIPSWPFWSLDIGLTLVDFCIDRLISPDDPDLPLEKEQAAATRARLIEMSRIQPRQHRGKFRKGFLLPRERSRFDQGEVAGSWAAFFRGETGCVHVYEDLLVRHVPLIGCDFINRPNEKEIAARGLMVLEKSFATPRTLADAGIILEPVV